MNEVVNFSVFDFNGSTVDVGGYDDREYRKYLKTICDYATVTVLVLIMFAMGADISFTQIWQHIRRPAGVATGMLCQFCVMPLVGFSLSKILNLTGAYAVGTLLIACCPGGAVSNIFTYYMEGDVSLSVTMTALSTLLDLGAMPFNFWLYGQFVDMGDLVVPYKQMATSLAFVTSPALVGVLVHWKYPKAALLITKFGSLFSLLAIVAIVVTQNFAYPGLLFGAHWKLVVEVLTMPCCGLTIGWFLSWALRQKPEVCKTVAIESGIQNVAVAMAVLSLSPFSFETQGKIMLFPMMYGISMITMCVFLCLLYRLWKLCRHRYQQEKCSSPEAKKSDCEKAGFPN